MPFSPLIYKLFMRKLSPLLVLALVLASTAAFIAWAKQRPEAYYLSDLRNTLITDDAVPTSQSNVLLIRPQLYPLDYQSPEHLRLKLASSLDLARQQGLIRAHTLVVLPEHIGTWLLAGGEKVEFYRARNRKEVRDWLLLGNPLLALEVLFKNLDADRLDEALLRMKAEGMSRDYQQLFSRLAREYHVTLQAGSILLPSPSIQQGQLHSGTGPLQNISLVFAPDGSLQGQPYIEAWPWQAHRSAPQTIQLGSQTLNIERSWLDNYPASWVQSTHSTQYNLPLFFRGHLSWPIGGADSDVKLTPYHVKQASDGPGSHILVHWLP